MLHEGFGSPQTQVLPSQTAFSLYLLLTVQGTKINKKDPGDQPLNGAADRHSAEDNSFKVTPMDTVTCSLLLWSRGVAFGDRLFSPVFGISARECLGRTSKGQA